MMAIPFILSNWKLLLGGLAVGLLGVMLMFAKAGERHWHKEADQTKQALADTVANYRAASDEATRLAAANVARVKSEQTAITERTLDAYQTKLADSASRYDRLRAQASGYLSRPSEAGLPDTRETTCRAVAGAGCDAIPSLLKAAQDNTDKLVSLQAWVAAQSAVSVNQPPASPTPPG